MYAPDVGAQNSTPKWQAGVGVNIGKKQKEQDKKFVLNPYWESYNDELLNGYIQEALENNFDITLDLREKLIRILS